MGDFDKKNTPSDADAAAKEKKKLMMVGVLGIVLAAVVGHQFMKAGPQSAQAFGGTVTAAPSAVPELTPVQALAGLDPAKDPTAKLLLGTSDLPKALVAVPRNPFKLSDDMRNQLVKAVEPVKPEIKPVVQAPQVVTQPKAPPADTDGLKLQGIFRRGEKPFASINGSIVTVGMTIGNARIIEIRDEQVFLRHPNFPGGPVSILSLKKN